MTNGARAFAAVLVGIFVLWSGGAVAEGTLGAAQVVQKVLEGDSWLSGAEVSAEFKLTDKRGTVSTLAFSARSRRHDPPFSKSIVRFVAPADLAGAGFLQVQNRQGDDDRFLFLPELKRARRVSGSLRKDAFMGTDFSFADLDRRDLREGAARLLADDSIGKYPCFRLEIVPRDDSPYGRVEIWVRKDNFVPLKMEMNDRAGVAYKRFTVQEVRRVSGVWFVARSKMENLREGHTTELVLDKIVVTDKIPDDEFTVRALEKL